MCELQFLTEVAQPRFKWKMFTQNKTMFSDSVDGDQLLRAFSGVEVGEGLPVGLRHHHEDEEGVEAGDGGEVEEDPGRTEEGHERLCELAEGSVKT